ncbi:hypothetical protein B0H10DRAFT_1414733 [Mycena sp. CBHHK59/15]|nr:hypothetical protein B0H10DRAFT_1414733 [Mycena sp. CBHHK59/15]
MKREPATNARKRTSKLRKLTATPQLGSDPRRRQRVKTMLTAIRGPYERRGNVGNAVSSEGMTNYRGTWEDEDEEIPNMEAGTSTQNYWDAIHNVSRPSMDFNGGQASSHYGQAVDVGDDEASVGSEIDKFPTTQNNNHEVRYEENGIGSEFRAQNHAHYEQPERDWDDQESVGSEIRGLSSLSAVNDDEEMSIGSEINSPSYSHYEQLEQDWDDQESVGSEIRGLSSLSAVNDDEEMSIVSEINSPSYSHYEQLEQDWDDQESVGSEIRGLSSLSAVNDDEEMSVGSEINCPSYSHYEQLEQDWDDQECIGSEIRGFSSISAEGHDEEINVGSEISTQNHSHYEQPERDWDDQESVGSEIRGLSSTSAEGNDEEISVGSEISTQNYSHYEQPERDSDDQESVGSEIRGLSSLSADNDDEEISVGSEINSPSYSPNSSVLDVTMDFIGHGGDGVGNVVKEFESVQEDTAATSSQPQVQFDQGSGSVWDSLVGYGSSEDEDEDFPSLKERLLPPQLPEPQYAVPTAADRSSTSSLPHHAVTQGPPLPMHHAESYVSPPRPRGSAMPHPHLVPPLPNHGSIPTPQRRCQERPAQFPGQGGAVPPLRSSPTSHQRHFLAVPPPRRRDTLPLYQRQQPDHSVPTLRQGDTLSQRLVPPPRTSPNSRQQPQPVHAVAPPRLGDTVPPHQRPVPPPRTSPTSRPQPVHGVKHPRQGNILPLHQRPVPPPRTSPTMRQQPQSVHSVPPPRQGDTLPPHQHPVPPPCTGPTSRQQPVHSVLHPRQGDTLPPHQRPVPPPRTGPTSRQQTFHGAPHPQQGDTVPPHQRPVPPARTGPTSRQQPFHGVPHPQQGDTVPAFQRPVPPMPDLGNTPGPQHSPPVSPQYNTAHPPPQKSPAPPKNSRRRTIQIDSSRARKRSNIGLPKRKQQSEKLILAEAVRELLGGLEECGALPDQVQQFQQRRLPRYGPRAGVLEYDTVGTMGSEWNKRLTDVTLELCSTHPVLATADASDVLAALKPHLRYRRANFKKNALNRSPDPELEEQRRLDINKYNRQHNT